MPAKIHDVYGELIVVAKPDGIYGFGTVGAANPDLTLREAWRMVQRAGLARVADRASGRVVVDGSAYRVTFSLLPDADLTAIKPGAWAI